MLDYFLGYKPVFLFLGMVFIISCNSPSEKREEALYRQYCASCHLAPDINNLPKDLWKNSVLPDMAARLDIEELYDNPILDSTEFRPKIKLADWLALQQYIISNAPDSLPQNALPKVEILSSFIPSPLALDEENGALVSFLQMEDKGNGLWVGDIEGRLSRYDFATKEANSIYKGNTPVTWYNAVSDVGFVTEVGILDPSELSQGSIIRKNGPDTVVVASGLHRPVHNLVQDLNNDGHLEMVISEFGNASGHLSLLTKLDSTSYDKRVLLNLPGCVRTLSKDMNGDGKMDLITMTSQAQESITILYQRDKLSFEADRVLEFPSIYGSSWFELMDYNGDGHEDIITVNGDNADKSYVHKPYHGMRIHLNNGENRFEETYFYPLNGATRVLAHDFDQDGDLDFGLISTFPNYGEAPERSFVYLENLDAEAYVFQTKILPQPNLGRWFLMDKGDVDQDGDMDILLSSFTYVFTPVPNQLSQYWAQNNTDVLVLKNKLN